MKRISGFEVRAGVSERDERHDGYFVNEADATRAAVGKGWYSGNGRVVPVELVIYDTYEEYKGVEQNKLRELALSKLSVEEREALGYK